MAKVESTGHEPTTSLVPPAHTTIHLDSHLDGHSPTTSLVSAVTKRDRDVIRALEKSSGLRPDDTRIEA